MGYFNETQRTLARGRSCIYGEMCRAGFTSGPGFYWNGFGILKAYGEEWLGVGETAIRRSEIAFGIDDENSGMTLTLSGVNDLIIGKMLESEAEIVSRPIELWGQFFDEAFQISDGQFLLFSGTMDVPTYHEEGSTSRAIIIPCEGEFADRETAFVSIFSTPDQQRRLGFEDDQGLEYVYRYTQGVRRPWPTFEEV